MATDAEIARKNQKAANYRSQIRANERKITSEQRKIDRLEGEIERLQRAYEILDAVEGGVATDLKEKTKVKNASSGYDWRGENKDKFDSMFEDEIYPDAKDLKGYVDDLKDRINWEIHERKSDIYASEGIIGGCKRAISWFSTCIRNLFN